ncbi:MAG: hypothetical protein FJ284_05255 [Planctomycetes bacterium]|nr:hypothetical protein [Planctomycetota bacterium]
MAERALEVKHENDRQHRHRHKRKIPAQQAATDAHPHQHETNEKPADDVEIRAHHVRTRPVPQHTDREHVGQAGEPEENDRARDQP